MLTAWPAPDRVIILAVGPHDRSAVDVYALLQDALAVEIPRQSGAASHRAVTSSASHRPTPMWRRRWRRLCRLCGHGRVGAGRPPPSGTAQRWTSIPPTFLLFTVAARHNTFTTAIVPTL